MQQVHIGDASTHIGLERKYGFYELYIKRMMDIVCSLVAIIVFCCLYVIVAVLVRVKLGPPVLFIQPRPGKIDSRTEREKIFYMYKFRTMSDERDERGNLLPDDVRFGKFGKALRATSLEGNDIIRQTTKSLINKRFLEVSPIHFYQGCNLISNELNTVAA